MAQAVGSVQGHRLVELDPGESVCLRPSNLPQQSAAKSWGAREHALPAVGGTGHMPFPQLVGPVTTAAWIWPSACVLATGAQSRHCIGKHFLFTSGSLWGESQG